MTAVRFYHLQSQNLDQVLPPILEKAYGQNHKIVVRMENNKEVERMAAHLWAYREREFLPHGTKKDGHADQQPIWITDKEENPNNADVLILTQGTSSENMKDYALCCEIFDGHNHDAVQSARAKWKEYKDQDFDVTYWYQSETGKWDQKS